MFVICPLSNCANEEKCDRFLECISEISPVTYSTEPQCQAYAWFRGAGDNDSVPAHWLRGFEVYENIEANTVTHRASAPYKAFRAAVGEEKLLERPSDLRFWRPTGTGFLSRTGPMNYMIRNGERQKEYIVVEEATTSPGMKSAVMRELTVLADAAAAAPHVRSFWVLDRGLDENNELLIFTRFESKAVWEDFEGQAAKPVWQKLKAICEWTRRTSWAESGIGFISR